MDDCFLLGGITSKERMIICYSFLIRIAPTRDSVTDASEITRLPRNDFEVWAITREEYEGFGLM